MGTSLTGLTPATTYDALIKVGDNGALSGTLKTLSDGLGNDSSLSLSTTSASLSGTLAVTGATTLSSSLTANGLIKSTVAGAGFRHFYNNGAGSIEVSQRSDSKLQLYAYTGSSYTDVLLGVDGSTVGGNVGIGTTAPQSILDVRKLSTNLGTTSQLGLLISNTGVGGQYSQIGFGYSESTCAAVIGGLITNSAGATNSALVFATRTSTTGSDAPNERMRITSDGYVRLTANSGGIQFNGDTAAANALDDYEEGTWTMGLTFGGGSTGNVYVVNTGTYTKIGRQVTVNGQIGLSTKGSSTGVASLSGLPFTVGNATAPFFASASIWFNNVTFAGQFQSRTEVATTNLQLWQTSILGVISQLNDTNFANNSEIAVTLTYFVA